MALCYSLLHSFWTLILSSDKITAAASLVVCIFDECTLVVFVWAIDENVEFVRTSQKPRMGPLILPWPTLSLDVLTVKQKESQIHKRAKYESKGQLTTNAHYWPEAWNCLLFHEGSLCAHFLWSPMKEGPAPDRKQGLHVLFSSWNELSPLEESSHEGKLGGMVFLVLCARPRNKGKPNMTEPSVCSLSNET